MVLPEIPDDAIETLRQASVVVEYPWDRYTVTMQRLAERIVPVRSLRHPPPYGFENTRRSWPHSNRVEGQAGAGEKLQGTPSRIMALRIVSSFRMAATSATRLGRPLATSRL
jgi:hypothetical protein